MDFFKIVCSMPGNALDYVMNHLRLILEDNKQYNLHMNIRRDSGSTAHL